MEISFTRLRVYLECPWKYKLMFESGRRIPATPSSSLGVSIHRTLEAFHRKADPDALWDCYERSWFREGFPDEATEAKFRKKGRRILEKYLEDEEARRTEILFVEREFGYPLGRHLVRGMIDRMDRLPDGAEELVEYKSQLDPESEDRVADNLQLRFYALGARESLGRDPSLMTVHYLAAGKRVTVPYDPAGEEALKALISRTADRIERGDFGPDTAFCPRCAFRADCVYSSARPA
jgi:CRISPR/Cas system-associated exonuclease Cas4 (RecB family)